MKKLFIILLFLLPINIYAQVTVRYFNAEWNKANGVSWCHEKKNGLSDCEVKAYDIGKDPKVQNKYKVVVVPTIIIFKDGEEVKRFQADISFKMAATREEVQEIIDEQLMSDF
tara:strand:+ start:986 stop:1324 length:339 start_codon:yes stop_codon:yes gene_type:complete